MLLKKMKLLNFRQFIGEQTVEFATDENKNVTVIMGENGSGKTTLAQAFTWCLYGNTDFDDKLVLNRNLERQLLPGNECVVKVEIDLTHGKTDYTIIREQVYRRELTGKIKVEKPELKIKYKKDGQQEFVRPYEVDFIVKQILPMELSRYFFFDGERIGNMSKEINKKGRSDEFAQAVRGLVGLNALIKALEHLKPTSRHSVIGSYNKDYDFNSDVRITQYTKEIEDYQDKLEKIDQRLNEIENEIQIAQSKCDELNIKLSQLADTERLQKEKEKLQAKLEQTQNAYASAVSSLLKQFNKSAASYFSQSLIKNALESLSKSEKLDKGIPDIHARTIEFLINRKICICGTKIEVGNEAYNELKKTLEYIPPQSIGNSIAQFVKESESRTRYAGDFFDTFINQYATIRDYENNILQFQSDIQVIEKQMEGNERAAGVVQELRRYEKVISDRQDERDELNQKKGSIKTSLDRAITERKELTLRDERNKKIEVYRTYALRVFEELSLTYKQKESETRKNLEININEIFKSIYNGGMSLTIDDRYNIQVFVKDEIGISNDVETSTAQSISIIFAFIAGIIKMARDNSKKTDDIETVLDTEPYPLVMDAPLSAFDKRRIKAVCTVLPNIAEQIIIFIKDTDGEIAEEHLGSKIGKRYLFDKKNEFETYLMPR